MNNLKNPIVVVRDGEEALDFLYERGQFSGRSPAGLPQFVLLDLKMPKVDGFEVLRTLKGDPALRSIPVIAMTSSAEESDMKAAYDLGVNSYVVKPVDFEQFIGAVKNLGMYWLILNEAPH